MKTKLRGKLNWRTILSKEQSRLSNRRQIKIRLLVFEIFDSICFSIHMENVKNEPIFLKTNMKKRIVTHQPDTVSIAVLHCLKPF